MIVDDSNIIRRRIERSQQIARLEVVGAASNGREAVNCSAELKPHVVTMDLTMPEMDGIECVQELVALNSKVLILVVSALADKATAVEAIEKGANGFLCKPLPTANSTTRCTSCCWKPDAERGRNPHVHRGRDELLRGLRAADRERRIAVLW